MWTKKAREQFSKTHIQKFNCERCRKYCEKPYQSRQLKYCSRSCSAKGNQQWLGRNHTEETKKKMSEYRIAHPLTPTKGKHLSEEIKEKISKGNLGKIVDYKGEKHWNWKGGISRVNIAYRDLHRKMRRILGNPDQCKNCGIIANGHKMHIANISQEYKKDKSDWISLCVKCHKAFDSGKLNLSIIGV